MSQANEQTDSADRALASLQSPPSTHARALGQVALLVTITVAAYLPAMQGDFLWDDSAHVPRPHLRSFSGLARIWLEPSATQQYYPLSNTLYWVQHKLWGDETLGYHLVNVVLHAANACLVLGILRKLNVPGALLAAAIFAVHPVHVESVAWISEQKNTLSALFYLSAAWLYLDFDDTRHPASYWGSFALFALGLLSKSVIASLPAALLLIFWWRRGTLSWRRDWTPLLLFFVVGACAGLFTAWLERTQVGADGGEFDLSFVERFLLASRVPWFYAWKLVWPTNLMFVYPRWNLDATSTEQWIYPILTFAVLGTLVVAAWRRKCRGTLAGVLFFLGTLFPVLGFLNVYPFRFSYVADHFQYLASLGLIVLAAAGLTLAAARMPQQIQPASKVAGALLVGLLAWLTWQQCHIYGDVVTLYRTTLARNPNAWMAHSNLGVELADGMRVDEAIQHYHEALRLKPDAAEVHYNLANAFVAKDKRDEAIAAYREALRYEPEYPQALGNLGSILAEQGQLDEAIQLLETAIRVTPYDPGAHDRLGDTLMNAGRTAEAAPHFAEALRLDPDHASALSNMSRALLASGNPHEAIEVALRAVALAPEKAAAHNNLGAALAQVGRFPEAIIHLRESTRLDPTNALALGNLAASYAATGRMNDAMAAARKAIEAARAGSDPQLTTQVEDLLNQLENAAAAPPAGDTADSEPVTSEPVASEAAPKE